MSNSSSHLWIFYSHRIFIQLLVNISPLAHSWRTFIINHVRLEGAWFSLLYVLDFLHLHLVLLAFGPVLVKSIEEIGVARRLPLFFLADTWINRGGRLIWLAKVVLPATKITWTGTTKLHLMQHSDGPMAMTQLCSRVVEGRFWHKDPGSLVLLVLLVEGDDAGGLGLWRALDRSSLIFDRGWRWRT